MGAIEKRKTLGVLVDVCPHPHLYGHEIWGMTERVGSQMQGVRDEIFARNRKSYEVF